MNQLVRSNEWEIRFNQEALSVEELLMSGDMQLLSQSKIRIALENKILSWNDYKNWLQNEFQFPVLKNDLSEKELIDLKNKIQENKQTFNHHQIWNEDILPLEIWDNHLIVLGLSPSDAVMAIPNVIFVLCSTEVMSVLAQAYQSHHELNNDENFDSSVGQKSLSKSSADLLSIDMNAAKPADLSFAAIASQLVAEKNPATVDLDETQSSYNLETTSKASAVTELAEKTEKTEKTSKTQTQTSFSVVSEDELSSMTKNYSAWNKIEENHIASCEQARKNFDAYAVLKIANNKTKLVNMDEDLKKENINETLLEYDLTMPNPFQQVFTTGVTESFGLNQLHLNILDFKYACVTPLKMGSQTIGFLVGFKVTKLNTDDEKTLEQLAFSNAA